MSWCESKKRFRIKYIRQQGNTKDGHSSVAVFLSPSKKFAHNLFRSIDNSTPLMKLGLGIESFECL